MSNEHLFLLKGTKYRPTPNSHGVISQPSMKRVNGKGRRSPCITKSFVATEY